MKDFNDLLNSGISDELLAAYIDGNVTPEESLMIQNAIGSDDLLSEAIDIVNDSIPFGNGDWGTEFGRNSISELDPPSIADFDNLFSFGIIDGLHTGEDSLFGDSLDFGLAVADSTYPLEDCHPAKDETDMIDGSETWESTDDFSNMNNLNY